MTIQGKQRGGKGDKSDPENKNVPKLQSIIVGKKKTTRKKVLNKQGPSGLEDPNGRRRETLGGIPCGD